MKQITFLSVLFISWNLFAQEIENVDYRLEGKNIVITYDFVNCKSIDKYDIAVNFNEQNGTQIIPKTISGDVKNVTCGSKRIVWNVLQDIHDLNGKWQVDLKYTVAKNDEYKAFEVKIGTQIWMNKNLDVAYFRNGEPIPEAKSEEEWIRAGENKQAAWCYYDNDPVNGKKYGKLYNWYAVIDPRGLAPSGWHIPSDEEWKNLVKYSGGIDWAGTKLKSSAGWFNGKIKGTNESGFSAYPGGYRHNFGSFRDYLKSCAVWSSSDHKIYSNIAFYRSLNFEDGYVNKVDGDKSEGCSVRCIKD